MIFNIRNISTTFFASSSSENREDLTYSRNFTYVDGYGWGYLIQIKFVRDILNNEFSYPDVHHHAKDWPNTHVTIGTLYSPAYRLTKIPNKTDNTFVYNDSIAPEYPSHSLDVYLLNAWSNTYPILYENSSTNWASKGWSSNLATFKQELCTYANALSVVSGWQSANLLFVKVNFQSEAPSTFYYYPLFYEGNDPYADEVITI